MRTRFHEPIVEDVPEPSLVDYIIAGAKVAYANPGKRVRIATFATPNTASSRVSEVRAVLMRENHFEIRTYSRAVEEGMGALYLEAPKEDGNASRP